MSFEAEAAHEAPGGAAAGEGAAAPAQPDLSSVLGKLDGLAENFGTFTDRLGSLEQRLPAPAEPEEEQGGGEDELAALLASLDAQHVQEDGNITLEGLLALQGQQLDERLARRDEQSGQKSLAERQDREMAALEERFPKLKEKETADATVQFALESAAAICEGTGLSPQMLVQEPRFLERMYLAVEAQRAQAEGRAPGEGPVPLERPGGGGPVGQQPQGDEGDRIVAVSRSGQFRL